MADYVSTNLEAAAYMAGLEDLDAAGDGPRTAREFAAEEDSADAHERRLTGRCGGCGRPVAPGTAAGACLYRGGPWHPGCRAADREAAAAKPGLF